ncbi:heparin lyase I family protein [Arthrobacter sp. NPDC090010]|uniref:heparin lyase I family protein n=1 Tax=Arthrobacter sp. NPDC090010 TaxID=3363942 RepID=UPI0038032B05
MSENTNAATALLAAQNPVLDKLVAGGAVVEGKFEPLRGDVSTMLFSNRKIRVDEAGLIRQTRAATNLFSNPLLRGGAPGIIGSGGVLPNNITSQGAFTTELLSAPGDGTMILRVSKTAAQTATRTGIFFDGPSAAGASVAGQVLSSMEVEILSVTESTGKLHVISLDSVASDSGSSVAKTNHQTIGVFYTSKADIGANPVPLMTYGPLAVGEYARPALRIENNGGSNGNVWSVTFRVSKVQVDYSLGALDRAEHTTKPLDADKLTFAVPADGSYDVLIAGRPGARWVTLASVNRILSLPDAVLGGESVSGVYAFEQGLTAREKNDALEAVDPAQWQQGTQVLAGKFFLADDGRLQLGKTERRYITSAPMYGYSPDGDWNDNIPVGWAFAHPSNRRRMERYEVRPGDQSDKVVTNPTRSEMGSAWANSPNLIPTGTTCWISYWINVEKPVTPNQWAILGQYHQNDAETSGATGHTYPLMTVGFEGWGSTTKFRYSYRYIGASTPPGQTEWASLEDPAAYEFGTWTHFVAKITTKEDRSGTVSLWRDGGQIMNGLGPIGYINSGGNMFQHGIYTGVQDNTVFSNSLVATYGNVQWGTTDLSAHITNPPPIV